jgi:hypothetical protein
MPKRNPGWKRYATSYGVYKVKKQGGAWIVQSPDGSKFPYPSREAAMKHFVGYTKPARKNPTKAQKREKAKRTAAKSRIAKALQNFVRKANPGKKYAGCKMQRNPGGSITIIPIKLPRGRK